MSLGSPKLVCCLSIVNLLHVTTFVPFTSELANKSSSILWAGILIPYISSLFTPSAFSLSFISLHTIYVLIIITSVVNEYMSHIVAMHSMSAPLLYLCYLTSFACMPIYIYIYIFVYTW